MNTTQTLAWLLCLVLAFFATIMAVRANYQAALTKKQFEQVQQVASDHRELLVEIRDVLRKIKQDMGSPAPAAQIDAAGAETTAPSYAE